MLNTPNKLTLLRVLMIPLFIALALIDNVWCRWGTVAVFIIASVTDFFDGYLARKYNLVTNFGKFMDPLADKLLVLAALCALVHFNIASVWAVFVITLREFAVTGLRLVAVERGRVIAASMWGKVKTTVQMIVIGFALAPFEFLNVPVFFGMSVNYLTIWIAAVITVISGIDYVAKNIEVFKD